MIFIKNILIIINEKIGKRRFLVVGEKLHLKIIFIIKIFELF